MGILWNGMEWKDKAAGFGRFETSKNEKTASDRENNKQGRDRKTAKTIALKHFVI